MVRMYSVRNRCLRQMVAFYLGITLLISLLPIQIIHAQAEGPLEFSGVSASYDLRAGVNSYPDSDCRTMTYEDTDGVWEMAAFDNTIVDGRPGPTTRIRNSKDWFTIASGAIGQWVSIKVQVPSAGRYAVGLVHTVISDGSIGNVYIAPARESLVSRWRDERYKLDETVNYWSSTVDFDAQTNLGYADLDAAGEYIVTFEVAAKHASSGATAYAMWPKVIVLDGGANAEPLAYSGVSESYNLTTGVNSYPDSDCRTMTYEDTDGVWAMAAFDNTIVEGKPNPTTRIRNSTSWFTIASSKVGNWVSIKVQVSRAGRYAVGLVHAVISDGCIGNVYIAPARESLVSRWRDERYKLDETVNYWSGTANFDAQTDLGYADLDAAGEYIVTFEVAEKHASSGATAYAMWPKEIVLDGIDYDILPVTVTAGNLNIKADGVSGNGLGSINVSGVPYDTFGTPAQYNVGSSVMLTASQASEGKQFLYWKNSQSDRILSTNNQYSFNIGSNTSVTAIYRDASDGYLVEFVDKNGKVLLTEHLDEVTTSVVAPEPYSVGYDFVNWKSGDIYIDNGDSVTVSTVGGEEAFFIAQYEKQSAEYTVNATGGSISPSGGSYTYNTLVTVTAGNFPAGQEFAYWARGGKIVSYDPEYSFYVWGNTAITAVSKVTTDTLEQVPSIIMDDVIKADWDAITETYRVMFLSERTLPDEYELIETGILISTMITKPTLESHTYKAVAQSTNANGQFTARKDGISSGTSGYARAYMIYKTPLDEYELIYSNTVNGTV